MDFFKLNISGNLLQKTLDTQIYTPWQSCGDSVYHSGNTQTIVAGVEYRFESDKLGFDITNYPSYITNIWDSDNNLVSFDDVLDSPVYVSRVGMNFTPTTANAALCTMRGYINDGTPKLIQTITNNYKATNTRLEFLFTYFVGSTIGYDMKNDGLYFTYTFETGGELYDRSIFNYNT